MRVYAVGGYSEVGKNMTVVELGEDAFVFDVGLYLPPIVEMEEKERVSSKVLNNVGALPETSTIDKIASKIRAIFISHAHLDHVGATPYIAAKYSAPILGTPYTIEILRELVNELSEEEKKRFQNRLIPLMPNSSFEIRGKSGNYKVEFIHITHSIPQSSIIALHTREGVIVYANDYKVDNYPVLGQKPNYKALERVAEEGIKLLIMESLYADEERKTFSESVARHMLRDVMTGLDGKGIIITTFSSHIARLKSIVDFGKELGREILFFGRSLKRYVGVANNIGICPFFKDIKLLSFKGQVNRYFKKVQKNRERYLVVCTGHQGEPGSVLDRLSKGEFPFKLEADDNVIFSTRVIPTPINQANRAMLEKRLMKKRVRIITDVHVSGHAGREDMRDMIRLLNPAYILPSHGGLQKRSALAELAAEEGYKLGKEVLLVENGSSFEI
ncbi:MAG: RNase J family beta-CASP ribonuclease [Candidatus Pacearchaeota archaeon]